MIDGGVAVGDDKQAEDTASVSADKYGKIFDYMLEGCQIISRHFRYLYVNDVVAEQGRKKPEDLLGRTMMECYPGIENTKMFTHLKACMEYDKPQNIENEFAFSDGTKGWFELRMEPLPEGTIILSIDITKRKLAEAKQKELDELKKVFMKIISEQMRSPLTNVRKALEYMRGLRPGESGLDEQIDVAHTSVLEVTERTDDIAAVLGLIDDTDASNESVLFEHIWRPVCIEFKRDCALKQITLECKEPLVSLPRVRCQPDKLRLVLSRLINNAILYTPTGGKITVTLAHVDQMMHFEIHDNGIGVPESQRGRIFNRFFRGSNAVTANPDGLGVSLTVAKYYVEQMHGQIGYKPAPKGGSVFWVDIPAEL